MTNKKRSLTMNLFPQPVYISILFAATAFLTAYFFYTAARKSKVVLLILVTALTVQAIAAMNGYFLKTSGVPPRFVLLVIPPMLFILWLFISKRGKRFLNKLDQETMTLLHVVRIPVEITLYLLFIYRNVPELMTFAGRNFDILAGLSAPVIYYLGYKKGTLGKGVKMAWNIISIALLLFIVFNALFSLPTSFQKFGLDQANRAVLNFPFVWLPGFIVPIVLLCHLATIRQLMYPEKVFQYSSNEKKRSTRKKKRR